jgi:hypothetical protein
MAREFGPQDIHIVHVTIDEAIDGERLLRTTSRRDQSAYRIQLAAEGWQMTSIEPVEAEIERFISDRQVEVLLVGMLVLRQG